MTNIKLKRKEHPANEAPVREFPETLICFSHLRWHFVYQRPQHLLSRFASYSQVYYIEEPVFGNWEAHFTTEAVADNLKVMVPHLPQGLDEAAVEAAQRRLLDGLVQHIRLSATAFWYYTPMAFSFSDHLQPRVIVYDCMDELAAFKFAPPRLKELEASLFQKADVVFTGGHSLYQAKKGKHANIYPFPSSIDKAHFGTARKAQFDPEDQKNIAGPRLGFFGVIDERFDIDLISDLATRRPDWQLVLIGPVVKIDPATLPQRPNIHYLGGKNYKELPRYLSGWDIALIPFANNESTRFISPTKTPEYLAAGIPVISTPIRDVIEPYGAKGLVSIAMNAIAFEAAAEKIFVMRPAERSSWLAEVDSFLKANSWDATYEEMKDIIGAAAAAKRTVPMEEMGKKVA